MTVPYEMNRQPHKTPMPERHPQERALNFEEVALGYDAQDAVTEARRCIQCSKAPCVGGCPVGVPIPQFIAQVAQGNFCEAYALVKASNALPAVCGRVCPQETQCESVCTRGKNGESVGIGRLERFVADWARAHPEEMSTVDAGAAPFSDSKLSGKKVAVVGSGPASLSCAGELTKRGCKVIVYEALHKEGGVLSYGIPEFRLPNELVAHEMSTLAQSGVSFEVNAVVGKLYDIDEFMGNYGFDAVFVGTGAGLPSYLGIEGEGLNGVMMANELLTRVNLMRAYEFPLFDTPVYAANHCVVVGGGNVAMDAARTARRLGAQVTVVYRRSLKEMPARAEEIHHAQEEGIKFQLLTSPTCVLGTKEGWAKGIKCVRMKLGQPDKDGRRRPVPIEGSEFTIDMDMLVVAVGSKVNPLIAQTTPNMEVTSNNLIVADKQTCATSKPGVFAGGDIVLGAATVISAMGAGKRAAEGIEKYLLDV